MEKFDPEKLLRQIFNKPEREKKYCNCAECGRELESRQVGGRIKGRPWCYLCLHINEKTAHNSPVREDHGPWQDNAIRALEGE